MRGALTKFIIRIVMLLLISYPILDVVVQQAVDWNASNVREKLRYEIEAYSSSLCSQELSVIVVASKELLVSHCLTTEVISSHQLSQQAQPLSFLSIDIYAKLVFSTLKIEDLEWEIHEKREQMRVIEQQIAHNSKASVANASLADMQQTLTRLMTQCNEKDFELEGHPNDAKLLS